MNKKELIANISAERGKYAVLLDQISDEQVVEPKTIDQWSVKDVVVHLTMWEAELIKTLFTASKGTKPNSLVFAEDFDPINQKWYETFKDRPLEYVIQDFDGVHKQIIKQIDGFSETDLFTPGNYNWLGNHTLAGLIEDICVAHEEHHLNGLQEWWEKEK